MDATGIDVQLNCATPVMFGYAWESAAAAGWAARMNDRVSEFCAADPRRLKALAQAPLQDIDAACREVSRARALVRGRQIGTTAASAPRRSGHSRFRGTARASRCSARAPGTGWAMPLRLDAPVALARPAETQLGIMSLICRGVESLRRVATTLRARRPKLSVVAGRVDNEWKHRTRACRCPRLPPPIASLCVDTAISTQRRRMLVEKRGADRVRLGTDDSSTRRAASREPSSRRRSASLRCATSMMASTPSGSRAALNAQMLLVAQTPDGRRRSMS